MDGGRAGRTAAEDAGAVSRSAIDRVFVDADAALRAERHANAGVLMRPAWRASGSARRQPQETAGPSAGLLPHQAFLPQLQIVGR
jgi:hypothetical protein